MLCLAVFTCTLGRAVVSDAQDRLSFFVEIEPPRSTFFTGDHFSIHVLSNRAELANFVDVEILAEDRIVWSRPLVVAGNRQVTRKGMPHLGASLSLTVGEELPPGVYRARARRGPTVSQASPPFTVEPWGTPRDGLQIALGAPASIVSGESPVVALSLRNTSDGQLHVPSGDAPAECATQWLTFVVFDDAGAGNGLRDDRKDCGHQPTVLLQPGEVTTYHVDLGRFNESGYEPRRSFKPARGRIRLHVSVLGGYYSADAGRPGLWKGDAVSNKVSIIVR